MKYSQALPIILFLLLASFMTTPEASAQRAGFAFRSGLFQQQMLMRQSFRPWIKIDRPKGADRTITTGKSYTYSYHVMRGWVSKIELRAGSKRIRTIQLGGNRAGAGRIVITAADRKAAGNKKITLWAWQGLGGFQSVHGESIRYTLK